MKKIKNDVLKILLVIYDNNGFLHYFPQGMAYIASAIRDAGYYVEIFDESIDHTSPIDLKSHLEKNKYDVVGLSIVGGYYQYKKLIEISNTINQSINSIWRFDPIIINDKITENDIIERFENVGNQLHQYTEKLIFSYIDPYKKLGNQFQEIETEKKISVAKKLVKLNKKWNLELSTCAESIDLEGIKHNKCIDSDLINRICGDNWTIDKKDKSQRLACGCIASSDIGSFKMCRHNCKYCYAN